MRKEGLFSEKLNFDLHMCSDTLYPHIHTHKINKNKFFKNFKHSKKNISNSLRWHKPVIEAEAEKVTFRAICGCIVRPCLITQGRKEGEELGRSNQRVVTSYHPREKAETLPLKTAACQPSLKK